MRRMRKEWKSGDVQETSYQSQGTHSHGTGGYRLVVYTEQQQVRREEQS